MIIIHVMTYISVGRNLFIDVNCLGSWTVADTLGVVHKDICEKGRNVRQTMDKGNGGFLICRHLQCSCITADNSVCILCQ